MRSLTTSSTITYSNVPIPIIPLAHTHSNHPPDYHPAKYTIPSNTSGQLLPNPILFQTLNSPRHQLYSQNHHFSLKTQSHIYKVLQKGWASATISRYSSTVKDFIQFCDLEDIPNHLRLPADEFVLCTFAASSAGKHAGNMARGRISAIKTWHTIHNIAWKGSAQL
ncbi:hypothetical protein BYT27DRAFT_7263647 [Phlegmacium glaucopus]|nr:hypothetical protein BYT27DRAFT_7263647 [Phlegmacium glaucopus]